MMELHSFTIYDIFKRNARLFKNKIAVQSEDQLSLLEDYLTDQCAGWLTYRAIGRETESLY
jgi:hypothetical protein